MTLRHEIRTERGPVNGLFFRQLEPKEAECIAAFLTELGWKNLETYAPFLFVERKSSERHHPHFHGLCLQGEDGNLYWVADFDAALANGQIILLSQLPKI